MKVHWQVEDGYAGKARVQVTEVPDADLDECETKQEIDALIEACVQNDFETNITWSILLTESE